MAKNQFTFKQETKIDPVADTPRYNSTKGSLMARFWPYERKYLNIVIFDLFCAALTCICDLVLPLILRRITNLAINDLAALSVELVVKLGLLYLVLRLIDAAAQYYMANTGHVMGVYIETDMRRDAFDHLQQLSQNYYSNNKIGQIMGRITNDLFDVTEFSHHCPEEFFIAGIKILVSFCILCTYNVPLTVLLFACVPLMLGVSVSINQCQRAAFRRQPVQIGELTSQLEASLLGERVIMPSGSEVLRKENFDKAN